MPLTAKTQKAAALRRLPYVPQALPRAFTLRDIEHYITQMGCHAKFNNPSRIAAETMRHWIKHHMVCRAGNGRTGQCGIPLYRRAR